MRPGVFSSLILVDATPGIAQIDPRPNWTSIRRPLWGWCISACSANNVVIRKISTAGSTPAVGVYFTPTGRAALKTLREEMLEHELRFTRLFSAEELAQLITFLRRIHP